MTSHYWSHFNKTPAFGAIYGNTAGFAGNNITIRGNEIIEGIPSQKPSQNMAQAHIKVLRWYKRACRLIPFILRIHNLQSKVNSVGAMKNLANIVREKAHYRDPHLVDETVQRAYEFLHEAEYHFTQHTLLYQYLCPTWTAMGDRGYSYLEKVKYANKSKFLLDFYKGNKSTAF